MLLDSPSTPTGQKNEYDTGSRRLKSRVQGPRRPPVFITPFSAHAADPSPGRLARWHRCPVYGAARHAAASRPAAPAGVPRGPRGASHACGRGAPCWPQELAARLRCFAERGVGAGARSGPESTRKVSSSAAGSACGPESVSANSECDCASLLWRVSFGTTAVSGSNQIRQSGHPSAGLRRFKRAGANLRGSGASPSVRER